MGWAGLFIVGRARCTCVVCFCLRMFPFMCCMFAVSILSLYCFDAVSVLSTMYTGLDVSCLWPSSSAASGLSFDFSALPSHYPLVPALVRPAATDTLPSTLLCNSHTNSIVLLANVPSDIVRYTRSLVSAQMHSCTGFTTHPLRPHEAYLLLRLLRLQHTATRTLLCWCSLHQSSPVMLQPLPTYF